MDPLNQITPVISSAPTPPPVVQKEKSLLLSILCGYYLIYCSVGVVRLAASLIMQIGNPFPPVSDILGKFSLIFLLDIPMAPTLITYVIAAGVIAGVIGFWLFQKWAVIVYSASSTALFIVALSTVSGIQVKSLSFVGVSLFVLASFFSVNLALMLVGILNFRQMK